MSDEDFRCRCSLVRCPNRATQEDMRCDGCRPEHAHLFTGPIDARPGDKWEHLGVTDQLGIDVLVRDV